MKDWRLKIIFLAGLISLAVNSRVNAQGQAWTDEDKQIWKKAVKRVVTTPPCCGACSVLSMQEGRQAYKYAIGEEKTPEAEKIYKDHEIKLMDAFRYFNPERYDYWFGKSSRQGDNK
jgi:formate dehydrogenase assembly factor FdhD